jgi:hypothetical protein
MFYAIFADAAKGVTCPTFGLATQAQIGERGMVFLMIV